MKNTILRVAIASSVLIFSTAANAMLSVYVSDNLGHSTEILDGADGSLDGKINWDGMIGSWDISIRGRGNTYYDTLVPDATFDHMHFDSLDVSGGAGELTIMFSETGLIKSSSSFMTSYGGVFAGTASFISYVDASNDLYGTGTEVADSGLLAGAFSGVTDGGSILLASSPYSWTTIAKITHGGAGDTTSFNYDVKIPEPASIALLGIGLIGFGIRRKARK